MKLAALLEAATVEATGLIHCPDGKLVIHAYASRAFNDKLETWYISLFKDSVLVNEFSIDREFTVAQVKRFVDDFSRKLSKLTIDEAISAFNELAGLNIEDPDSLDAFVKRFLG